MSQGAHLLLPLVAVAVAGRYGGRTAGIFALLLGGLAVAYFYLEPRFSFAIAAIQYRVAVVLFFVVGATIALLLESLRVQKRVEYTACDDMYDAPRFARVAVSASIAGPLYQGGSWDSSLKTEQPECDTTPKTQAHWPAPLRLLYLLAYAPKGTRAIDHLILEYAAQAGRSGWHITFGFIAPPPPSFAAELAKHGASWLVFSYPMGWRAARELAWAVRGRRPDVVQTSFFSPFHSPLLLLKLAGFAQRLVVLDHASGSGPKPSIWRSPLRRLRGLAVGRVVDAIVPVSHFVAHRAAKRVFLPQSRIHVILNGLDVSRFVCPIRSSREEVRIAFAGQLIPEKGVRTLLAALHRLNKDGLGMIDCEIAGDGPERAALESLCVEYGLTGVRFLGHIDSTPALFGHADIVVVPSEWAEAFGYVAIEAMACGAAVLASDAGALPEVVEDAGLLFRAGDPDHLAAQLRQLITDRDQRMRLAAAGRRRVETEFNLAKKVAKHLALCKAVLESAGKITS